MVQATETDGGANERDERCEVVVVGAGLAGLAAAATAAEAGASVLLLDGNERGGRATTDRVGRFMFNRGAHALYRRGPGRGVLKRLGVQVGGALPPTRGGLGLQGDRAGRLPTGPASLVRSQLLSRRSKRTLARVFAGMPFWRPDRLAERTGADWLGELAGADQEALAMLELLARTTTYVADFDQVSADLVATQMRSGLVGNVDYLHDGWARLVAGLRQAATHRGVKFGEGERVRQIVPEGSFVQVELAERTVVAGRVVVAAGTPEASGSLLPERPAGWSALGPPVRVACLDLGLGTVPELTVFLGVDRPFYMIRHSPPAKGLAPPGAAMVHAMKYLRPDEDPTPEQARAELEGHARAGGIEPDEAEEVRYLHRMVACGALPVAERGGMRGRPGVADTGHDRVLVAGDWVGPTGHLADAALASGEAAGRRAAEGLGAAGPVERFATQRA